MEELIEYIYKKKITTTFCSDALDKHGVIPSCNRIKLNNDENDEIICGKIHPVFVANGSNYALHEQIRNLPAECICVVFSYNINEISIFGSLVADYLFKTKKIKALVVHGFIRDTFEIQKSGYPIWCMGFNPIGCSNAKAPQFPEEEVTRLKNIYQGGLAICDSCGVVAIPSYLVNKKDLMINKMERINDREVIWDYCINNLGWDTFDTIIMKSYLKINKKLKWDDKLNYLVKEYKKKYHE